MKSNISKIILSLAALFASGCVYDFNPVLPSEMKDLLVVEGDIIVGGESVFYVSSTVALSYDKLTDFNTADLWLKTDVRVEAENGSVYTGSRDTRSDRNCFVVDTKECSLSGKYRLVVSSEGYGSYSSDWLEVIPAAETFEIAPLRDDENGQLRITATSSSKSEVGCYKWSYVEDWEYHSVFQATHTLDMTYTGSILVVDATPRNTNYYCWNKRYSSDILIASTENMEQNRVKDFTLVGIQYTDMKIQYLYAITVTQTCVSPAAYNYYRLIREQSNDVGGFFSPQPTEIVGNIRSDSNPDKYAVGYVSACVPVTKRLFVDGLDYYTAAHEEYKRCEQDTDTNPRAWENAQLLSKYNQGWRLVSVDEFDGVSKWASASCVDCLLRGGTKNRPDWWPNTDY